jgi:hypothetical protein
MTIDIALTPAIPDRLWFACRKRQRDKAAKSSGQRRRLSRGAGPDAAEAEWRLYEALATVQSYRLLLQAALA